MLWLRQATNQRPTVTNVSNCTIFKIKKKKSTSTQLVTWFFNFKKIYCIFIVQLKRKPTRTAVHDYVRTVLVTHGTCITKSQTIIRHETQHQLWIFCVLFFVSKCTCTQNIPQKKIITIPFSLAFQFRPLH